MDPFQNPMMQAFLQNPQLMESLQQMMSSDPELLTLLQNPTIMEKFQRMMTDPSAMQSLSTDPDVQNILAKMKRATEGLGGLSSMMGGMGRGTTPTTTATTGDGKGILHPKTPSELATIIKGAGKKLVVIDYTIPGCAPCARIAPIFEDLAKTYEGKAVFLKIDGYQAPMIATQQGIQSFPTFEFYQNEKQVDKFIGADAEKLKSIVRLYTQEEVKAPAVSPYKHFPLRSEEQVTYDKTKWPAVIAQLDKFNAQLKEGETSSLALTDEERKHVDGVIESIKDKSSWHRKKFSKEQYAAVDKMLTWPKAKIQPVLHIVRLLVLHPDAAAVYGKKEEKTKDLVDKVAAFATTTDKVVNSLLAIRTFVNCFNRLSLGKLMAQKYEVVFEALASLNNMKEPVVEGTDEQKAKEAKNFESLRGSCICLMINYAILFLDDKKLYEGAKIQALTNVMEYLEKKNSGTLVYRLLVVLGTLVYSDSNVASIARDLEVPTQLAAYNEKYSKQAKMVEVIAEIQKELSKKE